MTGLWFVPGKHWLMTWSVSRTALRAFSIFMVLKCRKSYPIHGSTGTGDSWYGLKAYT